MRDDARKRKAKQKRTRRRQPRDTAMGWSISGWCKARGIGRTTYYDLEKQGLGPAVLRPKGPHGWAQITVEADRDWAVQHSSKPISAAAEITSS
jgi:hypothetical protein